MDGHTLPLSIGKLNDYTLLAHRVIPQAWMNWEAWFDALGAGGHKATRTQVFDSFPLVLQAAVAGQGVAPVGGVVSRG